MQLTNNRYNRKQNVISLEEIHTDVYILSIQRSSDFSPGEIIALSLESNYKEARLYSICSGNKDDELKILFNVVPGGKISEPMAKLKKGDKIYCSLPYGRFHIRNTPSVWIANGTGIAPFISKIRSKEVKDQILIHGAREEGSFYFDNEFTECNGLDYIRCSSTEKGSEYYNGRVTDYLKEQKELSDDRLYYLCGSTEMVVETRDILISKGISFTNILSEIYF